MLDCGFCFSKKLDICKGPSPADGHFQSLFAKLLVKVSTLQQPPCPEHQWTNRLELWYTVF